MGDVVGRLHSVQSLGAVDGPGLRYVVFLQGCPMRCAYCHNPDTWDAAGGEPVTLEALMAQIRRYRSYLLPHGGVTVSGGEPLAQPAVVAALFRPRAFTPRWTPPAQAVPKPPRRLCPTPTWSSAT